VAYIDDDAHPDPHWLTYLAHAFATTGHAAVGGPNLAPPGDGLVADCVAEAPGGPTHILLSDGEAEHVPGCNMAFRREALEAVGGFDERFRVAGDDVDICWSIQRRGWTIGFSPAAFVWHRRRPSVRAYWRQQRGYGRAEALLEEKWPERYNTLGHVSWAGRIYGGGRCRPLLGGGERVHHGIWGMGLFQSLYDPSPAGLSSLPLMPEWYFFVGLCGGLGALGLLWRPLLAAGVPFAAAGAVTAAQSLHGALHAARRRPAETRGEQLRRTVLTAWLFWIQPQARLIGRIRAGLTPFRFSRFRGFLLPRPRRLSGWSERWEDPAARLERVESALRALRVGVLRGGGFDRWDLEVRGGMLGGARTLAGVEEHGAGRQMVRVRVRPRFSPAVFVWAGLFAVLAALAALDRSRAAAPVLMAVGLLPALLAVRESGQAMAALRAALAGSAADQDGRG
jgi:hypothetical protein